MQVGGVVPLAHPFAANAQQDGIQRAVERGVGAGSSLFLGREGRRRWRHHHALAQLFQGQLLVKALGAGNAFQRLAGFGTLGIAGLAVEHRLGMPIHPGAVPAGIVAHGFHGLAHHLPLAGTQGCSGLPAQHVVGQVRVLGHVAKVGDGIRRQALRRLLANHAPHPVALFGREVHAPFVVELRGGVVRIALGQLDERQRHQFLAHLAARRGAGLQVLGGGIHQFLHLGRRFRRHNFHRSACRAHAVGFHRQARLAPDIVGRELLIAVKLARRMGAAVIAVALCVPVAAHLVSGRGRGSAFEGIDQQCVAAHFLVVRHAVAGVLLGKLRPVAALAQQQQPVVAQAVFLVGAGVALQKGLDFCRAGLAQAQFQLPVSRPGLQGVAACGGQQLFELLAVALAEGLVHFQQGVVATVLRLDKGRCSGQHSGGHKGCQNRSEQLHGGII